MDDKIIKESPHIKYLGVILDNKLNWIEKLDVKIKLLKVLVLLVKLENF